MKQQQVLSAWRNRSVVLVAALIVVWLSGCNGAGDFRIVIAEPNRTMTYGRTTRPEPITFTVAIAAVGEWNKPVALSLQGPLDPAQYSFSANPVTPPATSSLTIRASVVSASGPQSIDLTVVGESVGNVRSQKVHLDVIEVFP